ncbi:MAG: AhpC/TSA family protein [Bacteroidales bacterium]|nr:AhpC/TSA family protein [Candidatus Colimorpha merdihippi]
MKRISLLMMSAILLLLCACNSKSTTFTINGEIPLSEFEGRPVYLATIDNGDTIDSAIVQNGQFQFGGTLEKNMMGRIFTIAPNYGMSYASTVVLESGKIYVNLVTDSLSGTPLNDYFFKTYVCDQEAVRLRSKMDSSINQYYETEDPQQQAAFAASYDSASDAYVARLLAISRKSFKVNGKNILGAYALSQIVENNGISFDSLDYLMSHAEPVVADYKPLRYQRTHLFHLQNTAEGKHYVDIAGVDFATSQMSKLSAMIDTNKITLVDFWASWCHPCRQEISQNLNRLYEEYKDKGLNIIGVDVWDKTADHKAAVENLGIQYPQLVDTTRNATEEYGIDGIPTIMLLDKDGTIVRRGIRGEEIEAAILNLLNKE